MPQSLPYSSGSAIDPIPNRPAEPVLPREALTVTTRPIASRIFPRIK